MILTFSGPYGPPFVYLVCAIAVLIIQAVMARGYCSWMERMGIIAGMFTFLFEYAYVGYRYFKQKNQQQLVTQNAKFRQVKWSIVFLFLYLKFLFLKDTLRKLDHQQATIEKEQRISDHLFLLKSF